MRPAPRLNARQRLSTGDGVVSVHLSALSGDPRFTSGFTESTNEHSTSDVPWKASLTYDVFRGRVLTADVVRGRFFFFLAGTTGGFGGCGAYDGRGRSLRRDGCGGFLACFGFYFAPLTARHTKET